LQRLDSLDFLRGWASVFVVISHLMGVFWVSQSGLEGLMGYENIGKINLFGTEWIINNRLFLGQLGVAIFFLISGYVITLSLEKYHGFGFLINRIIRIYPVYIAGFFMTILGLYLVDFQNDGIPYTITELFIHILIIPRQWLNFPAIDGISWTLEIELYFYLTMYIIYQLPKKIRNYSMLLLFFSSVVIVYIHKLGGYELKVILMIGYMLLGYFFYIFQHGLINKWHLLILILVGCLSVGIYYQNNAVGRYLPYLLAPILFWVMLFRFKNYKIDNISKFLSQISYPLYVVHPIFGYGILIYLLKSGFSSWNALIIVLFLVFILAYMIHLYVERPAMQYAKKFNYKNNKINRTK